LDTDTQEGTLFVLGQYNPQNTTGIQYEAFLQENFGSTAPLVANTYPLSAFNSSPFPAFSAMSEIIKDVSYFFPAHRALNVAVQNGVPAWTYLWDHTPSCAWFNFIP
jgi:para-nitrobenzyl esterase